MVCLIGLMTVTSVFGVSMDQAIFTYAKEAGNQKVVDMLIAAGANPDIKPGASSASSGSTSSPASSGSSSKGNIDKANILIIAGFIILVVGHFGCVALAFQEGLFWGVFTFMVPGGSLLFALTHWAESKKTFFIYLSWSMFHS